MEEGVLRRPERASTKLGVLIKTKTIDHAGHQATRTKDLNLILNCRRIGWQAGDDRADIENLVLALIEHHDCLCSVERCDLEEINDRERDDCRGGPDDDL